MGMRLLHPCVGLVALTRLSNRRFFEEASSAPDQTHAHVVVSRGRGQWDSVSGARRACRRVQGGTSIQSAQKWWTSTKHASLRFSWARRSAIRPQRASACRLAICMGVQIADFKPLPLALAK